MLNLYQKIQKIESLQAEADRATANFKRKYNIDCLEHCSKCCRYEAVNATPIEFLPLTWHLYKTGKLEEIYDKVSNYKEPQCVFSILEDGKWGCSVYPARGMICRLFGFASVLDKHGKPCFAACHSLKEAYPEKIDCICRKIENSCKVPIIADFYRKLQVLDFKLGDELVPINQAIKEACEVIYMHTVYK